ncbi:MAG: hypothetical protein IPL76_15090 [Gemmatimonadetes bacterium]|nr:hypothetical protein [Gemmatimonadota bacterium]
MRWIPATLLALAAAPLVAQAPGTVEVGAFGRFSHYDSDLNFDDRVGVGGRLGIFVLTNLALGADAAYNPTYTSTDVYVRNFPLHGRLVYNLPIGGHTPSCWAAAMPTTSSARGTRRARAARARWRACGSAPAAP